MSGSAARDYSGKRTMNLALAGMALLLALVPILLVTLLVKLTSKGGELFAILFDQSICIV